MVEQQPIISGSRVYFRLLGYMKPHLHLLIVGFTGFLIFAACDSAFAWWMKELVDSIESGMSDRRYELSLMIIGIFVFRGIGGILGSYTTEYVARKVINSLRREMFDHILKLPCAFYQQYSSGSLLSRLIFNVEQVSSASTNALRILVRGGLTVLGLLIFMFYINWKLSSLFLVITPLMALIIALVSKRFRRLSQKIQQAMGNVSDRAGEVLRGYEVVKIFDGYKHENRQFEQVIENDRQQRLKLTLTNDTSSTLVQLLFAVTLAVLILVAMQPEIFSSMSAGEFVSFVTAAGFISRPVMQLTQVNAIIQQGVAAADSIFAVIDIEEEQDDGRLLVENCRGELRFEGVKFRYERYDDGIFESDESGSEVVEVDKFNRQWVIDDVDFTIPAGTTCALVGRSGSGKSTLAHLVARFHNPASGVIRLDGVPLQDLSIASLRENIALVNQNISLFNASIADNIAYGGMHEASRHCIEEAARHAQVMEFAGQLPNGLDTQIGESGLSLSGGQRQRIAIARAFLKDAPILILDEATSALDTQSERLIQQAIQHLMSDRTSLIIAHRLSTIEQADQILVLDQGRVVESGNHQQLLALQGAYADMYKQGDDIH